MRTRIILILVISFLVASCTTQEDRLREFVEQDVVGRAEDYLISQAIAEYIKGEANNTIIERANYWYNNFTHDWSWVERDLYGDFVGLAKYSGSLKKKFDERMCMWSGAYNYLTHLDEAMRIHGELKGVNEPSGTYTLRTLVNKHYISYTCEYIGDLFFKPERNNFHEISESEKYLIYGSLIGLGIETYHHDVVDDIRIRKTSENLWNIDLVYHSGDCLNFSVIYKEGRFMTMDTPWWSDEQQFVIDSLEAAGGLVGGVEIESW